MLSNLTGWHFIVILFVVLLLFGAPKLPALARSLGQSAKILKTELRPGDDAETKPAAPVTGAPAAQVATPPATTAPVAPAASAPVAPVTPVAATPVAPPAAPQA
jgi:sec-independent protein translocase protein TatA